ncbi:hypothetical protein PIB30_083825 [Stylosanthes scabra]|uniref:Uncharacterized protein n=1 Tax=Stylosanthes scabra TaxID=79078 RepID=A0ABU6TTQ5_9FABA|nr:hypothetical protein [Stylosanthes scabra]
MLKNPQNSKETPAALTSKKPSALTHHHQPRRPTTIHRHPRPPHTHSCYPNLLHSDDEPLSHSHSDTTTVGSRRASYAPSTRRRVPSRRRYSSAVVASSLRSPPSPSSSSHSSHWPPHTHSCYPNLLHSDAEPLSHSHSDTTTIGSRRASYAPSTRRRVPSRRRYSSAVVASSLRSPPSPSSSSHSSHWFVPTLCLNIRCCLQKGFLILGSFFVELMLFPTARVLNKKESKPTH